MRSLVIFTLLSGIVFNSHSQLKDTLISDIQENHSEYVILNISEGTNNSKYNFSGNHESNPDKFELVVFDEFLSSSEKINLEIPKGNDKQTEFLGARCYADKFYVFATYIEKNNSGSKINSLYAYHISNKGIENKILLSQIAFTDDKKIGEFHIAHSPSGFYFAILAEHPAELDESETVTISVYDDNIKPYFQKELAMDVPVKRNIHNYIYCSNSGNAYIVKKDKDKNNFRYLVYSINSETTALISKTASIPNKQITDIRASVNESGQLLIGGFISSDPIHEYRGYFLMVYDASLNQISRTFNFFDQTTLESTIGKKSASKDPVLRGYFIDKVVSLSNGNTYVIAEVQKHTKDDKITEHHYGNVLIIEFSKDGKYSKSYCISKFQSNKSTLYSVFGSYNIATKKDTLYFIFNDLSHDLVNKSSKATTSLFLKCNVVTISMAGGMRKFEWIPTFDSNEIKFAFEPELVFVEKNENLLFRISSPDLKQYRLVQAILK